jgi:hypothetical protein
MELNPGTEEFDRAVFEVIKTKQKDDPTPVVLHILGCVPATKKEIEDSINRIKSSSWIHK